MAISEAALINIMRNVTGRVDATDPLFTDTIMAEYLNNFITLQSTMDVRLIKNKTWWEFLLPAQTVPFTNYPNVPVDLQTIGLINGQVGASTIGPDCYANGFIVFWYQDPKEFYQIWPQTQFYQPARPTYVLYYNNELTFRNPPNIPYWIKIEAYQVEWQVDPGGVLNQDYVYRYFAYGAALDIFADFGEMDKWNEMFPVFRRYRSLVLSRTYSQYQNQRPSPEF